MMLIMVFLKEKLMINGIIWDIMHNIMIKIFNKPLNIIKNLIKLIQIMKMLILEWHIFIKN
jgi:hypothetical protein